MMFLLWPFLRSMLPFINWLLPSSENSVPLINSITELTQRTFGVVSDSLKFKILQIMNRQTKTVAGFIMLLFFPGFIYAQEMKVISKANIPSDFKTDSTALNSLVGKLLKWHAADRQPDFEPLTNDPKDTM